MSACQALLSCMPCLTHPLIAFSTTTCLDSRLSPQLLRDKYEELLAQVLKKNKKTPELMPPGMWDLIKGADLGDLSKIMEATDWLTGQAIDTAVAAQMHWMLHVDGDVGAAGCWNVQFSEYAAQMIYIPTYVNTLVSVEYKFQTFLLQRRTTAGYVEALRHASIFIGALNLSNTHWVAWKVDRLSKEVFIYDSASGAEACHIAPMLRFICTITHDDRYPDNGAISELVASYKIQVIHGGVEFPRHFPCQPDGNSCGVFAIVILWHFICNATVHLAAHDVPTKWRQFIPIKIIRLFKSLAVSNTADSDTISM